MLESAAGEPGFQKEEGSGTGGRRPQGFSKPCERRTEDAPGALTATSLKSRTNEGRLPNAKRPAPANGAGQGQLAARLVLRSAGRHARDRHAGCGGAAAGLCGRRGANGLAGRGRGPQSGETVPPDVGGGYVARHRHRHREGSLRRTVGLRRQVTAESAERAPAWEHRECGEGGRGRGPRRGPRCGVGSRAGRGRGRGGARPGALGPPVTPPGPRPHVRADRQAECPLRAISRPCTFLREASVQLCGPTLNWVVCFLTIEFPHLYF